MQEYHSNDQNGGGFAYSVKGQPLSDGVPVVIWAHGWGQSHQGFAKLIEPFETRAHHICLDFPGFGASPLPPEGWGTAEYADLIAEYLKDQKLSSVIWVGHSFGCRVGTQIAARHPDLIRRMVYIAGAGLKLERPLPKRAYLYCRIRLFKLLRRFVPDGAFKDRLMVAFGSTDYKNAGPMRQVFIRVVNEDLSEQAAQIRCPVTLVYGSDDTETPPQLGQKYKSLISDSVLHILDGQDHYSVLDNGRHQVVKILNDAINNASSSMP